MNVQTLAYQHIRPSNYSPNFSNRVRTTACSVRSHPAFCSGLGDKAEANIVVPIRGRVVVAIS
jgi:hypothetical protein